MGRAKQKLQSAEYIVLSGMFKEWLELLGYSPLSIPALLLAVTDFLQYQEWQYKTSLQQLEAIDATNFIQTTIDRGCGSGHINKQVQALKLFSRYLRESGQSGIGFNLERVHDGKAKPIWLTKQEIQSLYEVTGDSVLGIRDRAMLAVFYGCGLRLNEGASLELKDIDRNNKRIHVRKGKHYKERIVPLAGKNFIELCFYMDYGRPQLLQDVHHSYLFVDANKGRSMNKQSLYVRIRGLTKKAKLHKKVGTHTLRHSIATHLLQSGMKLERIQQFLGHGDLDSTQIYTHLAAEA
jgi:site-specific recombinase XerD